MPEQDTKSPDHMDRRHAIVGAGAIAMGGIAAATAMGQDARAAGSGKGELVTLWTSGDPDVAHRVALMYTHAALKYKWFPKVRLVIWGPSQRTLVGDKDLQAKVKEMQGDGIEIQACIACAKSFGIVEELRAIGFEVIPMGPPLTRFLNSENHAVVTF
jgi:hypothetical protein